MIDKNKISARDVLHFIKEHSIEFVDFKFVDLFGRLQHVTLSSEEIDEDVFFSGIGFDGSSVRGFQPIDESDMIMRPDSNSFFTDPFFDQTTISFFCDIIDPISNDIYSRDSRGVAMRAEKLVNSLGIADTVNLGPELEFFIFDEVRFDQATQHGFYYINSEGAFWNTGVGGDEGKNLGHRAALKEAYYSAPPTDLYHNIRSKIVSVLKSVGVNSELHHHEVAAAGQNEIGIKYGTLLKMADNAVKFKYVVKNVANKYDKTATFMPKPLFGENGAGMHVSISFWKNGTNLFYESGSYGDISKMAEYFIGGLLKHAPALCAFVAPTTNSYRRLVPGYEAPINLAYSYRNRSACVRIPMSGDNTKTKRLEFRTPDPSANPYLAFASIIMAGLDGINNKISPPAPIDTNIYELDTTDDSVAIESVPESLEKSIDALESDHKFLLDSGVFTKDLIDLWIETKRVKEMQFVNLRPHPSEFTLYFDV